MIWWRLGGFFSFKQSALMATWGNQQTLNRWRFDRRVARPRGTAPKTGKQHTTTDAHTNTDREGTEREKQNTSAEGHTDCDISHLQYFIKAAPHLYPQKELNVIYYNIIMLHTNHLKLFYCFHNYLWKQCVIISCVLYVGNIHVSPPFTCSC